MAMVIHDTGLIINGRISPGWRRILKKRPEIEEWLITATSFLEGENIPMMERVRVVLVGLSTQPHCENCGKSVRMRLTGKHVNTYPSFCSTKCTATSDSVREKRQATIRSKYGVDYVWMNDAISEKRKTTWKARYGVDNPAQAERVKEKRRRTIEQKYGSNANQLFYEKRKQTCKEKYGHESVFSVPEIRDKAKATTKERYGVENILQCQEGQELARAGHERKYGTRFPIQNLETKTKIKTTMVELYGVEHALQHHESKKKRDATMVELYGTEHALRNDSLREQANIKRIQTNLERYGCPTFFQSTLEERSRALLENKEFLIEENKTKTLQQISMELGVAHSTVGKYFRQHNISVVHHGDSQAQRDLYAFIKSIVGSECVVLNNCRDVIPPSEIDIFIPSLKIGFEYNGLLWHSDGFSDKGPQYHINKTEQAERQGIRLIQIYEHEWLSNCDIVLSRIRSILRNTQVVYARQCTIKPLSSATQREFFQRTHIQGGIGCKVAYGLFYNDTLVGAMSFGGIRFGDRREASCYELIRFSTELNTTVVGGADKLFAHFVRSHSPQYVVSYCDRRWSIGGVYRKLGFNEVGTTAPGYFYFKRTDPSRVFSRQQFQKHKLNELLTMFDPALTEWENMRLNNYDRVWDCGHYKFEWSN